MIYSKKPGCDWLRNSRFLTESGSEGALMEKQMIETVEPEIGRVRQMYLDFHDEGPYPRRGDEV